jgi:hypothetical protein
MGITAAQRKKRRGYLGGSDAGAIIGVDEWCTPFDVWAERCLELSPEPDPTPGAGQPAELGDLFEDAGIVFTARALEAHPGYDWALPEEKGEASQGFIRNQFRVGENGVMAAHLDAILFGTVNGLRAGVEAKSTNLSGDWGEPWTDQVPPKVEAQCQHGMYAAELDVMFSPCFTPSYGRMRGDIYVVYRDNDTIAMLEEEELRFWELIQRKKKPDDWIPTKAIVNRMVRKPRTWKSISMALVRLWKDAKSDAARAEKLKNATRDTLAYALGDCEGGDLGFGAETELTFFRQSTRTMGIGPEYSEKRCEHCKVGTKTTTYPVLRERKRSKRGEVKAPTKTNRSTESVTG